MLEEKYRNSKIIPNHYSILMSRILSLFHRNNLHRAGFCGLIAWFESFVQRCFIRKKAFLFCGFQQNGLSVFLRHTEVLRGKLFAIVTPDTLFSLQGNYNHYALTTLYNLSEGRTLNPVLKVITSDFTAFVAPSFWSTIISSMTISCEPVVGP